MAAKKKQQQALKHQRAVARRTTKQSRRPALGMSHAPGRSSSGLLKRAGTWSLHESLVGSDWRSSAALTQIVVARRSSVGQIAVGVFLMDLACLGIKSALARVFDSQAEYERGFRASIVGSQEMEPADLNLAAKIIREGYLYALDLGFQPDPESAQALMVMGDADPDACAEAIPVGGPEGKPLFVSGPHDNTRAIIQKLTQRLGPDGFGYIVGIGGSMYDSDEGEWDQDDLDEDDGEADDEDEPTTSKRI